jgi:hypothetical protein
MIRSMLSACFLLVIATLCAACNAPAPTVVTTLNGNNAAPPASTPGIPAPTSNVPGGLSFKVPDGWTSAQPTSSMRVAQYKLPGESGDASLVIYYFGQGQGGKVEDNFDRWVGQMQQTRDKAKTETLTVNGMAVTLLDVSGTYSGDMMGGAATPQPDSRMRAGVIESPKGNYYIKLVGPTKTVTRWDDAFMAFVKSAEFKK